MNKTELIHAVAVKSGISKTDASKAVDALIDTVSSTLQQNGNIIIFGFGTFKVTKRSARTGRNPRTGQELKIPAKKSATFTASKALKTLLNQ